MILTAIEISIQLLFLAIQLLLLAFVVSYAPAAVPDLAGTFGPSIFRLSFKAGVAVHEILVLSSLLFSFFATLSCGIAATLLVAASSWVVTDTILAAVGMCTAAAAPGQPSVSHVFYPGN